MKGGAGLPVTAPAAHEALRGLGERAVERAGTVARGYAVLEEASPAERQPDGLHVLDRHEKSFHNLRTAVVKLAVPVRPQAWRIDGLTYDDRPLWIRDQWHAHWVRPPESGIEAGRAGARRTGCLGRLDVKPHAFIVGDAPAVVLILEGPQASGHLDRHAQRLHAEVAGQAGVRRGEERGVDVRQELERGGIASRRRRH